MTTRQLLTSLVMVLGVTLSCGSAASACGNGGGKPLSGGMNKGMGGMTAGKGAMSGMKNGFGQGKPAGFIGGMNKQAGEKGRFKDNGVNGKQGK